MIENQQRRIKIGTFAGGRSLPPTSRSTTSGINTLSTMISPRSLYSVAIERLCLYCYIIIIAYTILLYSGNVELNPGPNNCKKCLNYLDEIVPIKLKVCTCGMFSIKEHIESHKSLLTTVTSNIVTDNGDVPIVQSQPKFVSSNVVVNTESESSIPKSKPVIEKMSTSQKWEKHKININKRRSKYRCNPSPIKAKIREAYNSNPWSVRECV